MTEDEKYNTVVASLHLKEASELLKFEFPDASDALLQLTEQIMLSLKVDETDVLSAENMTKEILSGQCNG